MRRKYVLWRYALVCERLRCEPWRPSHLSMVPRLRRGRHSCRALSHPLYLARSKLEVYPSCGRSLALARCHHGGSPRTSQRAPSSPRDALATPHPSKSNDRAPPPPASPCLRLRLRQRLRLALQPRTRTRARTRRPRSLPRSNLPREFRTGSQKLPARTANRFDHRRAGGSCKGIQGRA